MLRSVFVLLALCSLCVHVQGFQVARGATRVLLPKANKRLSSSAAVLRRRPSLCVSCASVSVASPAVDTTTTATTTSTTAVMAAQAAVSASNANSSDTHTAVPAVSTAAASTATAKPKAGEMFAKYGAAYLLTSITLSLFSFGTFYFLLSRGVDVAALLAKVGIEASASTAHTGTAAIAYAMHKAASPIRFPPTVALTPLVAKWIGYAPKAKASNDTTVNNAAVNIAAPANNATTPATPSTASDAKTSAST